MNTDELSRHTADYAEHNKKLDKLQREREGRQSTPPSAPRLHVATVDLTSDRARAIVKALLSNHTIMSLVPLIDVEGQPLSHAEFGTLIRRGAR